MVKINPDRPGRKAPIKQLVSIRVDADVLAWYWNRGKKYQTYMNQVLRREMQTNALSKCQ